MSQPFLGQICIVAFNFAPRGYAFCDGQKMKISQNPALYAVIGSNYGGDGRATFALPDMRGRVPVFWSFASEFALSGGTESVTLTCEQMPQHTHDVKGTNVKGDARRAGTDANRGFATTDHGSDQSPDLIYGDYNLSDPTPMNDAITQYVGGGQPHTNMQPFLPLTFCIAIQGVFPERK